VRVAWIACVVFAGASLVLASRARADDRLDRALAEQKCSAREPSCDWLATLSKLDKKFACDAGCRLFYLATPPQAFEPIITPAASYLEKLTATIASGDIPDLTLLQRHRFPVCARRLVFIFHGTTQQQKGRDQCSHAPIIPTNFSNR